MIVDVAFDNSNQNETTSPFSEPYRARDKASLENEQFLPRRGWTSARQAAGSRVSRERNGRLGRSADKS